MAIGPGERAVGAGQAALARGDWGEARRRFAEAVESRPTPAALEGLGIAARYALDADAALAAHEAGYRLAREADDSAAAARLAVQLAYDAYAFRGPSEAAGWVERAAMLVEGEPPSTASAYIPMMRAHLALLSGHDPVAARAHAEAAIAIAREVKAIDAEMLATGLAGLALVSAGDVEPGMRRVDAAAAAALAGEMTDVDSIESVCCYAIDACKRARDLQGAQEWCLRVREIATRFGDRQMFSVCRTHYADVLLWHGDWAQADAELTAAAEELGAIRPGREADALARLAELRRRQGRTAEAEALAQAASGHPLAALVAGLLALDRGDAGDARDAAARFLRRIGDTDRFERVAGLELAVRAAVAAGDRAAARTAASELAQIASASPAGPLRAAALLAEGRVAAAESDAGAAVLIEDAAERFDAAGARYDAALARLELVPVLRLAGRTDAAARAQARARAALDELGAAPPARLPAAGGLTQREAEILRLIARGRSNADIAQELVLSVRTVERHAANVYVKIGASGRTARAAATAWAYAHGIA